MLYSPTIASCTMTSLPDFRLETHFSKWEFKARYHMTASDAESMSLQELLSYASPEERAEFDDMWLGYTETFGAPDVREEIANTFKHRSSCLLYTSPSPRDRTRSRMPSSA